MANEIQRIKKDITHRNWSAEIEACQSSGMTVSEWCARNGVNKNTYYSHLRKLRIAMLSENCIVSLNTPKCSGNIEINTNGINISVPTDCPAEAFYAFYPLHLIIVWMIKAVMF